MKVARPSLIIAHYLERLGCSTIPVVSHETLETLQTNHIQTFSHDTIDSCLKRPISLYPQNIIAKFLAEKRGGLCFELNGAFCYLLQQIGFEATLLSSNVKHVEKRKFDFTMDTHAVIMVKLKNIFYLVDVGFADSFRKPIAFDSDMHDVSGNYRVSKLTQDTHGLYKYLDNEWLLQYTFNIAPKKLSDFHLNLKFVCNSPKHDFSHSLICTRPTENGHIALIKIQEEKGIKKRFIIKDTKHLETSTYDTFDDIKLILIKNFGMDEKFVRSLKESVPDKKNHLEHNSIFMNKNKNKKKSTTKTTVIDSFPENMLSTAFCQGSNTAKKFKFK